MARAPRLSKFSPQWCSVWPFCPFIYFSLLGSFHFGVLVPMLSRRVAIGADADAVGFFIIAYYVGCSLPYLYNNYFGHSEWRKAIHYKSTSTRNNYDKIILPSPLPRLTVSVHWHTKYSRIIACAYAKHGLRATWPSLKNKFTFFPFTQKWAGRHRIHIHKNAINISIKMVLVNFVQNHGSQVAHLGAQCEVYTILIFRENCYWRYTLWIRDGPCKSVGFELGTYTRTHTDRSKIQESDHQRSCLRRKMGMS